MLFVAAGWRCVVRGLVSWPTRVWSCGSLWVQGWERSHDRRSLRIEGVHAVNREDSRPGRQTVRQWSWLRWTAATILLVFVAAAGSALFTSMADAFGASRGLAGLIDAVLLLPVALLYALYVLPSLMAFRRAMPDTKLLLLTLFNVFLGWTVLAWIGCLVWAFKAPARETDLPTTGEDPIGSRVAAPHDQPALVPCTDCDQPLSVRATTCPNCGAPGPAAKRRMSRRLAVAACVLVTVGAVVAALIVGNRSPSDTGASVRSTPGPATSEEVQVPSPPASQAEPRYSPGVNTGNTELCNSLVEDVALARLKGLALSTDLYWFTGGKRETDSRLRKQIESLDGESPYSTSIEAVLQRCKEVAAFNGDDVEQARYVLKNLNTGPCMDAKWLDSPSTLMVVECLRSEWLRKKYPD